MVEVAERRTLLQRIVDQLWSKGRSFSRGEEEVRRRKGVDSATNSRCKATLANFVVEKGYPPCEAMSRLGQRLNGREVVLQVVIESSEGFAREGSPHQSVYQPFAFLD